MKKKKIKTVTAIISMVMCLILVFNSSALAVNSQKESLTLEDISIIRQCGVLEGESIQLQATLSPSDAPLSGVEWSSSNPSVIECDKNGRIKGIQAGGYANITCKSKWNKNISDTIKVYCVKPLAQPIKSGFEHFLVRIYAQPSTSEYLSTYINWSFLLNFFISLYKEMLRIGAVAPLPISNAITPLSTGSCTVYGQNGKWCYIRLNDNVSLDGFVQYTTLTKEIPSFLYLNKDRIIVYSDGVHRDDAILKAEYNGNVTWTVSDDTKIDFNRTTGQITGKLPGVVTITAKTADGMSQKCKVISVYKWPQSWNVTPSTDIQFYEAPYTLNKSDVQKKNKSFYVVGDMGDSSNWCLVNNGSESSPSYHFAKIDDFSTKGTISQYNLMNFRWPVNDINIRKISSPFGPRSSNNGGNHKGFDIVSDTAGEVEGESVVASYNGTIMKIYIDNNKKTSHGNAIVITTNKIDPISGKNLTVIYMHLSRWDTNSSGNIVVNGKVLKEGDSVTKEQIIGCAGNTGYNTSGAHLHYEVNNQNAAIRSGSNNPFTETINPIYFYMSMDESITKSDKCEAASNGNGFYWYGENK